MYKEIFELIDIFVHKILVKLPIYKFCTKEPDNHFLVFQSFSGHSIPSSRITLILRIFLFQIRISFSGTLTDLRKVASTLTGKFDPKLNDLMAVFLCHSRKAHDQYYCMNVGLQLENLQADPEQIGSCSISSSQNSQSNNQLTIRPSIPSDPIVQGNLSINDSSDIVNEREMDSSMENCFPSSTPLYSPITSIVNLSLSLNFSVDYALESIMVSRGYSVSNFVVSNQRLSINYHQL